MHSAMPPAYRQAGLGWYFMYIMQMYPSEIDDSALEMHAAIQEKVGTPKSRTIDEHKDRN